MTRFPRALFPLVLAAVLAGPSAALAAGPPPAAPAAAPTWRTVEIQVDEVTPAGKATSRFVLAVADDGPMSEASTDAGPISYRLRLRRAGGRGRLPALVLDFRRSDRSVAGTVNEVQLSATAVIRAGHRAVVGRIERPDGGFTEVSAEVR